MEAGVGDLAAARLWERVGLEDAGGWGGAERSVRDGSGCGTCSAGSVSPGPIGAVGVSVTEGGSTAGGAGGWAAAEGLIV